MENVFIVCLSISYMMYAILNTDVLYYYLKDTFIGDWLKISEYEAESKAYLNYIDFLRSKYSKKFFVSLITCPVCLSFWFGAIASEFTHWYLWLLYSFVILAAYGLLKTLLKE